MNSHIEWRMKEEQVVWDEQWNCLFKTILWMFSKKKVWDRKQTIILKQDETRLIINSLLKVVKHLNW